MSSKILPGVGPESEAAAPLTWRQLRIAGGASAVHSAKEPVDLFAPRQLRGLDAASPLALQAEDRSPGDPRPHSQPAPAPPPPPPPGVPLELYQSLEQRSRELEARIPQVEKQARQTGYQEGEQAAQARWEKAIEHATRTAAEMASLRPILRRRAEEDVVRLAMAVARRILRREATIDTDAVLGLLKAAFERVEQREVSQIRVRPDDTVTVSRHLERIGSPFRIEVVADSTLERGAMVLETSKGSLDASLETQLEEIERGFTDLLKPR